MVIQGRKAPLLTIRRQVHLALARKERVALPLGFELATELLCGDLLARYVTAGPSFHQFDFWLIIAKTYLLSPLD